MCKEVGGLMETAGSGGAEQLPEVKTLQFSTLQRSLKFGTFCTPLLRGLPISSRHPPSSQHLLPKQMIVSLLCLQTLVFPSLGLPVVNSYSSPSEFPSSHRLLEARLDTTGVS